MFMKKTVFVLFALFLSFAASAQVKVYDCSLEEGLKMAAEQGKLVLVDCTSPGG